MQSEYVVDMDLHPQNPGTCISSSTKLKMQFVLTIQFGYEIGEMKGPIGMSVAALAVVTVVQT